MLQLGYATIREVSALLREGKVSSVDLVEACLHRIDQVQPQLNAFITVTRDSALGAAALADREIQSGNWKGVLHGIPIGLKDFYDTASIRTTAAFEHFKNRVPQKDAPAVEKLKKAGAIIVGKTNMHTLGMGTTGLQSYFGAARNPWNLEYIPGGSSSGSAAAVASGLCYATLDTDAIGSCRLPAACCGVVGFKGSYGLVNMQGILAGEQPADAAILWMAHAGITARSVEDTALMLDVLANQEADGKLNTYGEDLTQERKLTIGTANNVHSDTEVLHAFEEAIEKVRSLGYSIGNVPAPLVKFGRGVDNIESDRKSVAEQAFKDVDLLLLPTVPTTTPLIADAARNPQDLSAENTLFANYYGLPAINVPCGFDKHGLPLGLQIVGKPRHDRAVLRLAYQYQQATEYSEKHPIA
jgi:aspartyl-tRNA(Asn)/glutamyl-tRNA(Gln) amidotransferase subunit A